MLYLSFFWPFMLLGWLGWPAIVAFAAIGTYLVIRDEVRFQRLPKMRQFRDYLLSLGGRTAVVAGYFLVMLLTLSTCVAILG
ncbi:hypothetical protein AAFN86_19140 [Roseomonas sp. CAU 1739]|uniref:hypothetical protein n=1 Tax=Roseomonas sp. CAU 1739 TaxID=3140364 RepID=UPI00325ADF7E